MKAKKLVYGVGVNDADYKVNTIDENGKSVRCPIYTQWKNMLARCYGESTHKNQPTYRECVVDPRWHSFMSFKGWMITQRYEGLHLDKDVLFEGNKVYDPDTCVFVSTEVNMFLSPNTSKEVNGNDLPRGVFGNSGNYRTFKSVAGKSTWYRGFATVEDAYAMYLTLKNERAAEIASKQVDPRISSALLTRFLE